MPLTHDYRHHFRGLHGCPSVCRIRVYRGAADATIIVATELEGENRGTSVTNAAEALATELERRHCMQVGFLGMDFGSRYDFALSFAGADRAIAESIAAKLAAHEIEVFYDKNEQHRILAKNVEDYLGPIYRSEARFVVVLLGPQYPSRVWTKFESEQFKTRFGAGSVIPMRLSDAPPGMFDLVNKIGGLSYDRDEDMDHQTSQIVDALIRKLAEVRAEEVDMPEPVTVGGATQLTLVRTNR